MLMRNKNEFVAVIKENEGIIYKVSKTYCNTSEDQKDLYQEIVYQLWKSFESFKGNSKFSTWMYRIALNTSITFLKKETKREKASNYPVLKDRIEHVDNVMEERVALLYKQIQQLNVIEKGIILPYLEGKSYEEISEITGFSTTNIGTRLNRIKLKLKKEIKK